MSYEVKRPAGEPVFSLNEGDYTLQVWPHSARGTVEVRSHEANTFGQDAVYHLSGHDVRTFAQDVLTTAGGDRTFVVSRFIAYPVEEDGVVLRIGVGDNRITTLANSSPERLETVAANFAAAAAYLRDAPERERVARMLREGRQDAVAFALFGPGVKYAGLGLKARAAVEAALEAQDELMVAPA